MISWPSHLYNGNPCTLKDGLYIWNNVQFFSVASAKMHFKMASILSRPQCSCYIAPSHPLCIRMGWLATSCHSSTSTSQRHQLLGSHWYTGQACSSKMVKIMTADALAPCVARTSAAMILTMSILVFLNSSPPSAVYMRQCTGSALVQVMACRMFGAKPSPESMLAYCQLDH